MSNIDLRAYVFLDSLQASTPRSWHVHRAPAAGGRHILSVEVSPGIEINRLTDIALKATTVKPGMQLSSATTGCSISTLPRRRRYGRPARQSCARSVSRRPIDSAARAIEPDHSADRRPPGPARQPDAPRPDARSPARRYTCWSWSRRPTRRWPKRGRESGPHQHPRGPGVRLHGPGLPGWRGGGHRRRLARSLSAIEGLEGREAKA